MKSLEEMTTEIRECNQAKGWLDTKNTWGELLALLHTELAEITGAYRKHRLADATFEPTASASLNAKLPPVKPEGVGSELADTLIRLLSMYDVYNIPVFDMDCELADVASLNIADEDVPDTFGDWVAWLHRKADALWDFPTWEGPVFLRALVAFAAKWEQNLAAEYERKIAYNWTRQVKHGETISDALPASEVASEG